MHYNNLKSKINIVHVSSSPAVKNLEHVKYSHAPSRKITLVSVLEKEEGSLYRPGLRDDSRFFTQTLCFLFPDLMGGQDYTWVDYLITFGGVMAPYLSVGKV